MKLATKILAAIILAGFVAVAGSVAWFLYDWSCKMSPATYVSWLNSDPAVYVNVDSISATDLQFHAYTYDKNKFVNAISGAARLPEIADANGRIPAFKLGDDIFILTWKRVNSSAGLAISDSSDFKTNIESPDHCFRVRHLTGNIYEWVLDLESPHPNENADNKRMSRSR